MTNEQFEWLPVYAKEEIKGLRRDIEHVRKELLAFTETVPSRIRWGWGFQDEASGYLRDDETVLFMLGGKHRGIRVKLIPEKDAININGDDGLLIELGSGNDCRVRLKP